MFSIHPPSISKQHCQAAGRSQEILRCMQRWKLRHLPGPWTTKDGVFDPKGAEIILPMKKLYHLFFWGVQNFMIPTMIPTMDNNNLQFHGTSLNHPRSWDLKVPFTIDSGVTGGPGRWRPWLRCGTLFQCSNAGCMAQRCLAQCLLWMLWLLLSWMLKLGCMEDIWFKLGEFLAEIGLKVPWRFRYWEKFGWTFEHL